MKFNRRLSSKFQCIVKRHITNHDEHIIVLYEHLKSLLEDKRHREEIDKRKRIGFNT